MMNALSYETKFESMDLQIFEDIMFITVLCLITSILTASLT